jgi:HAD superfamily hydrolase (TIGR01459 family)
MSTSPAATAALAPIHQIPTVDALVERHDGFLLDIWGVIHDGRKPFPGVLEALARLRQAGRPVVLLSNASRPAAQLDAMLSAMGVARDLYDHVVSSGEACRVTLERMAHPWLAGRARRCLYIGDVYDHVWMDPMGIEVVVEADAAHFLLLTSIEEFTAPLSSYLPTLEAALAADLPLLCANPDRKVMVAGQLRMGSGTLADWYEARGGRVIWFGKPHAIVYDIARELLTTAGATNAVAIGDALETDILGANRAGFASALVPAGGVHRVELGLAYGELPPPDALAAAAEAHGAWPTYALAALR